MDEPGLLVALGPVAGLHAPGLEIAADRTGGDLAIGVLAGQPDLDVVGLAGAEAHIAGAQDDGAERQTEALQHFLGAGGHALVLVDCAFLIGDRDHLDLVELVLAQHAARVAPGRAGLGAEAWRQRGVAQRQRLRVEDLLADKVGERHLGGGDEPAAVGLVGHVDEGCQFGGHGPRRRIDRRFGH